MRIMQISSSEWRDLKGSIETGNTPAGVFLAHGPSEEIAVQAQAILEDASHREYPFRYFLCSGSNVFRVPCFLPFPGGIPLYRLVWHSLFAVRWDRWLLLYHNEQQVI